MSGTAPMVGLGRKPPIGGNLGWDMLDGSHTWHFPTFQLASRWDTDLHNANRHYHFLWIVAKYWKAMEGKGHEILWILHANRHYKGPIRYWKAMEGLKKLGGGGGRFSIVRRMGWVIIQAATELHELLTVAAYWLFWQSTSSPFENCPSDVPMRIRAALSNLHRLTWSCRGSG